ncbi:MAG: hypothetical protein AAB588_03290 [Patescibacteria group bacterium]
MKTKFTTFLTILTVTIFSLVWTVPVFAQDLDAKIKTRLDEILPNKTVQINGDQTLPKGNLYKEIVPQAINIFLMIAGVLSTGVFIYAGIMLIIAQGNEEEMTKFKNILIWSIIGSAFIVTAYAIVSGLLKISFV